MKYFTCLILVAALIGCAKDKNTDQSISTNFKFEITDSFRVNHLEDFLESLPKYAAVFDSDYKLLQDNIELLSGTISTPIINKEGQNFVHKNQRLLGEEDWNTYYSLKLKIH
ncbi:hypothetical protein SAMN00777080_3460 [Aquiflexum balticum DSM 16537]|uniref:Uncharacterized protein n=1 Tax=Aquiflexum balticum DSM 16537 TaxID=758820 RepID=A0A1W2H8A2_9BACT|nr:hypothetical protein [Aquiflexum balticum]SMD44826.1 hypothetical protein SAMN00777080_3460 [Aquiflexum balticum DSM 16537]